MVDFSKRLGKRMPKRTTDPVELYDTLDRASDKGPLRQPQEAVLNRWYAEYASTTTLQAAPVTFGYAFQFDTYRV